MINYKIPENTLPCWFFSENEKNEAIKNNKPFKEQNYFPNCFFQITQRLDNTFIQGYLGNMKNAEDVNNHFHSYIDTDITYFSEFRNRQQVYFTFDKISYYRLIEIIECKPILLTLKRIDLPYIFNRNQAFMIMPFKFKELNDFYNTYVKDYLKTSLGINVFRADDFNDNDVITDTIYNQIEQSEFIITDTTNENKNVFYELGYAAAKNKEIITIQNIDEVKNSFFDRAHIRAIFYSLDKIDKFQQDLSNTIITIRSKVGAKL